MQIRLALLGLLLVSGSMARAEESYRTVSNPGKIPSTMAKQDFKRGQADKDGRLIFLTLHHPTRGTRNLAIKGDYGMMVFYDEESKQEGYEFYSKKDLKITKTASLDEFLKLIAGMPRGSRLDLYNLCLMGTHYGYPESKWKQIGAACTNAGVGFDPENPSLSCTCEDAKDD